MTLATFIGIIGFIAILLGLLFTAVVLYVLHNESERELAISRINALEAERVQGDKAGLYLCEDCGWSGDELVNVFCCPKCEAVVTMNRNSEAFKTAYIGAQKENKFTGTSFCHKDFPHCHFDEPCQCASCRADRVRRSVEYVRNRGL